MKCPWCGSPVIVKGSWWECGYCGDSGRYRPKPVICHVTVKYILKPEETWQLMRDQFVSEIPNGNELLPELGKAAVYQISCGLSKTSFLSSPDVQIDLERFLRCLPISVTVTDVLSAARNGQTIFRDESILTNEKCGTFWKTVIERIPRELYYDGMEPDLTTVWSELGHLFGYFGGGEMEGAESVSREMRYAFPTHWIAYIVLHPDVEYARAQLQKGIVSNSGRDFAMQLLVDAVPELLQTYPREEWGDLEWYPVLTAALQHDTSFGISLLRVLLDAAGPALEKNEELAEKLLDDWLESRWLREQNVKHLCPFLDALEDSKFARQVFQSASVGGFQRNLLVACRLLNMQDLGIRMLCLLEDSPFPQGRWRNTAAELEAVLY